MCRNVIYILHTDLNAEEWGEDDVAEDDEVDLIEEAAEHEDHEDEVHDGKHAQGHPLHQEVGWKYV